MPPLTFNLTNVHLHVHVCHFSGRSRYRTQSWDGVPADSNSREILASSHSGFQHTALSVYQTPAGTSKELTNRNLHDADEIEYHNRQLPQNAVPRTSVLMEKGAVVRDANDTFNDFVDTMSFENDNASAPTLPVYTQVTAVKPFNESHLPPHQFQVTQQHLVKQQVFIIIQAILKPTHRWEWVPHTTLIYPP